MNTQNTQSNSNAQQNMKLVTTLAPEISRSCLSVANDNSDSIEMAASDAVDLDLLQSALNMQQKHGALGESLQWLWVEYDENRECELLLMKEDRANADWLKSYQAVYWFVCGWADAEFASQKGGAA